MCRSATPELVLYQITRDKVIRRFRIAIPPSRPFSCASFPITFSFADSAYSVTTSITSLASHLHLNVVDNLLVVHDSIAKKSILYDIRAMDTNKPVTMMMMPWAVRVGDKITAVPDRCTNESFVLFFDLTMDAMCQFLVVFQLFMPYFVTFWLFFDHFLPLFDHFCPTFPHFF